MSAHCADELLTAFRDGTLADDAADAVREHLASCQDCRARGVSNVVSIAGARRRGGADRLREAMALARRLQQERIAAAELVPRLLRETAPEELARLAANPELRSCGHVEQLARESTTRLEREPYVALALAEVTREVAMQVPADVYPPVVLAQLRATVTKDHANALRYLGRYDEALTAIAQAKSMLEPFGTVAHDLAIVRLLEAIVHQQLGRHSEALAIAHECHGVFEEHGDTLRVLYAAMTQANVLYEQARYADARNVYEQILPIAAELNDAELVAKLQNNLGFCSVHLGAFDEATRRFAESIAGLNVLGRKVEAIRTERGAGLVLLARERYDDALELLRDARAKFAMYGLVEESGLCGLDVAEVLVRRGMIAAARELAHETIAQFAAAKINRRAVQAIEYLTSVLGATTDAVGTIRYVHAYIESLRTEPEREFVAV
jgi:tetratricopeptide (TPR) repeat protein